jgi:hypothetical protein
MIAVGCSTIARNHDQQFFWPLLALYETRWFATFVALHNDPNYEYHLDMFETIIIGSDLQAELDIVNITVVLV